MKRVEKFLKQELCPDCGGTRLSETARAPRIGDSSLDSICRMTLEDVIAWVRNVPDSVPSEMKPMGLHAESPKC